MPLSGKLLYSYINYSSITLKRFPTRVKIDTLVYNHKSTSVTIKDVPSDLKGTDPFLGVIFFIYGTILLKLTQNM